MKRFRKLSDEGLVGIVLGIWEVIMLAAVIVKTPVMWTVFIAATVILIMYFYFDLQRERDKRKAKRSYDMFIKQTDNFMRYIYTDKK